MMDLPARLEPVLAELGYELVTLERAGRGLLRIFIDKPEGITIEDCAKVVEFLVTDLSDYVTGKTITIDGGFCEHR